MNAAEVLSKARDVLADVGWCQLDFHDSEGRVCTYAALTRQSPYPGGLLVDQAADCLKQVVGGVSVTSWNDRPERTYEDVILALKQAEELAVERGL